jgi:hypothetical protein
MPWRAKPASRLRYWSDGGPADFKAQGFKTILVYCVGPPDRDPRPRCWHYAEVKLDDLPDWGWYDTAPTSNARSAARWVGLIRVRIGMKSSILTRGLAERPPTAAAGNAQRRLAEYDREAALV